MATANAVAAGADVAADAATGATARGKSITSLPARQVTDWQEQPNTVGATCRSTPKWSEQPSAAASADIAEAAMRLRRALEPAAAADRSQPPPAEAVQLAAPPAAEPPRRRSTVREPAPVFGESAPVVDADAAAAADAAGR